MVSEIKILQIAVSCLKLPARRGGECGKMVDYHILYGTSSTVPWQVAFVPAGDDGIKASNFRAWEQSRHIDQQGTPILALPLECGTG
jgi:hypothetical protein